MNPDRFRTLALACPGASEESHMGHPDFRIVGKVFAGMPQDEAFGVLNLTPEAQSELVEQFPTQFEPLRGAWGVRGWTKLHFAAATIGAVRGALVVACKKAAPTQGRAADHPGKPPRARKRKARVSRKARSR